jgi:hypothetical protein
MGQAMPRSAVAALLILLSAAAAGTAIADATVACNFNGKAVQAIIVNSKDGPRSCNATCVWSYANMLYRGAGGAILGAGESKTIYNNVAPMKIDGVAASGITCNR